jgi:hypothetical protein
MSRELDQLRQQLQQAQLDAGRNIRPSREIDLDRERNRIATNAQAKVQRLQQQIAEEERREQQRGQQRAQERERVKGLMLETWKGAGGEVADFEKAFPAMFADYLKQKALNSAMLNVSVLKEAIKGGGLGNV